MNNLTITNLKYITQTTKIESVRQAAVKELYRRLTVYNRAKGK